MEYICAADCRLSFSGTQLPALWRDSSANAAIFSLVQAIDQSESRPWIATQCRLCFDPAGLCGVSRALYGGAGSANELAMQSGSMRKSILVHVCGSFLFDRHVVWCQFAFDFSAHANLVVPTRDTADQFLLTFLLLCTTLFTFSQPPSQVGSPSLASWHLSHHFCKEQVSYLCVAQILLCRIVSRCP